MSNDDLDLDGMTEEELDAILESDDPDKISALFDDDDEEGKAAIKADDLEEQIKTDTVPDKTEIDTENDKLDVERANSSVASDQDGGAEYTRENAVILSKDGKHQLPYGVVESARGREAAAKAEAARLQKELDEERSSNQKTEMLLKRNGVDLEELENGEVLTDEVLGEIAKIDPEIGKVIRILSDQNKDLSAQVSAFASKEITSSEDTTEDADPVELAIQENTSLSGWRKSDQDRWETAVEFDGMLQKHPDWKDKSFSARFAEAERLTKKDFGDPLTPTQPNSGDESGEDAAKKALAAAKQKQAPRSLTDLGQSPATEKSQNEVIAELDDADAIAGKMEGMSTEQIDQLLADIE